MDPNKQFHYITGKILATKCLTTKLISTTQYFFRHYDIHEHGQYCLLQKTELNNPIVHIPRQSKPS